MVRRQGRNLKLRANRQCECSASTFTSPSAARSATTATSTGVFRCGAEGPLRRCAGRRDPAAEDGRRPTRSTSAADAVACSSPPKSAGSSRACRPPSRHARAEMTLEANPETRRSPGWPAFAPPAINRVQSSACSHSWTTNSDGSAPASAVARASIREARAAGFDNVSLDLMMWLPGQTAPALASNVEALIAAAPTTPRSICSSSIPTRPCGKRWRGR